MFSLLEGQYSNTVNDPDNIVILRHDFQSDKFTMMNSDMSVVRGGCAAVVINNNNSNNNNNNNNDNPQQQQHQRQQSNQVLVFGGGRSSTTDVVESCDIINNNLNQQQQWRRLGRRMPMTNCNLAAVNLTDNNRNEKVYLFGGFNRGKGGVQNSCYEYDVTSDTYKNMPSMKTKRLFLASVCIKNKLLFAIGGCDSHRNNRNVLDTVEYFDTTSANNNEEWRILKVKMNKKRYICCSASVSDIVYVIGGSDENARILDSIEMYDTSKQNSKFVLLDAKMKTARVGSSAVVLGCYIIVFGGQDEHYNKLNSIEIFNTKTQEFVDGSDYAFPRMTIPRTFFSTVLVDCNGDDNNNDTFGMRTNSKKIVVIGGAVRRLLCVGASRTAEVIDIKTTAIPISKFCFTKSNDDEYDNGKLPSDINKKIVSFLIEPETKNNS